MKEIFLLLLMTAVVGCNLLKAQCNTKQDKPCLSVDERLKLRSIESRNIAQLSSDSNMDQKLPPSVQGTLIWPLKNKDGLPQNDYKTWYVSNQVDLNMNIDTSMLDTAILDYNCGMRSYDTAPTYNHDGTDIVIYPHPYIKMNNNAVEVIAAATGVIVAKVDTNGDKNCVWGTGRSSNNLTLLHVDGSKARYVHLKRLSLTTKVIGDTIVQGEYIGIVGSSGNSTVPHLHFELENASGQEIDPFFGPCSDISLTTASWWANQIPYVDSSLNKLMTYSTQPINRSCDLSDSTGVESVLDERILFAAEDSVWYSMYFTHVDQNDTAHAYIYKPDNTVLTDFPVSMPGSFSKSWSLNYYKVLDANPDYGEYEIRVVFMGKTYQHNFIVADCPTSYVLAGNVSNWQYWQANDWISSTANLLDQPNTEVVYKTGDFIELGIGFEVESGADFNAKIAPCGNEGN